MNCGWIFINLALILLCLEGKKSNKILMADGGPTVNAGLVPL